MTSLYNQSGYLMYKAYKRKQNIRAALLALGLLALFLFTGL